MSDKHESLIKKSVPVPKKSKKELSDEYHRKATDSVNKALRSLK